MKRTLYQPCGASWHTVLQLAPEAEFLRPVLDVIDAVHGTTLHPQVSVVLIAGLEYRGHYRGHQQSIALHRDERHLELTLLHEVGHVIDHLALGADHWASEERHPWLIKWRRAVLQSEAVGHLLKLRQHPDAERDMIDYYLRLRELFARSYAQYVATHSHSHLLRTQLRAARTGFYNAHFWRDNDFRPLATAFDDLLMRLQWTTTKPIA